MELSLQGIADKEVWEEKRYDMPQYNIERMRQATKESPFWIHFGAGSLFRAFHAEIAQRLLNSREIDRGIIVAEGYDYEIIEKIYKPYDNLGISVTLKADKTVVKTVTASVAEALPLDTENYEAYTRLQEIFQNPSLQMATFTITEKGYSLTDGKGTMLLDITKDFMEGPQKAVSYMGKVASLLYARYQAGQLPIALVSTDNCSHNGDRLYEAVAAFAKAWTENGRAEAGFLEYICSDKVSFTWSMIDKITPRPADFVKELLSRDGLKNMEPVITSRNTYTAPFVNAEETEYLVIQDTFPNGRPDLEKAGLIFTDRETVDKVEKMKVCTCPNPLHTCLAVFGCLLGYKKISDEMKDSELRRLVEIIGYEEGLPAVVNPGILDPKEFIDTVLKLRLPNPFLPDTPQRIATDTSQKLRIRFGETIQTYRKSDSLKVSSLRFIPLVFAGWLRYLMAADDEGRAFELSPDPYLPVVCPYLSGFGLEEEKTLHKVETMLRPVLENEAVFGVNLYEAGMAELVCQYFIELSDGTGAVRRTLKKYILLHETKK